MNKIYKNILLIAILISIEKKCVSQKENIYNNYISETGLQKLKIERQFIYLPKNEWMYSHHPFITHFKNYFIAVWSNGMIDEDKPGQRIVFAISKDFFNWSTPQVLAAPSAKRNDTLGILTAAGFHQFNDTLVVYYGEYSQNRSNTKLCAKITTDGEHWSNPIDLHIAVNPNYGPQIISSGRLIICGNFTFPYTDDYRGLSNWTISSFYADSLFKEDNPATFYSPAEKNSLPPLCEGSFYETDDHVLHMLLRVTGKGWKGKLWQTKSNDNGTHWSFPVETNFSDNDSKFHFGRLPDKQFYYVGIPDTLHHYARTPLVLSLSDNGLFFNKHFIIADELYTLQKEGLWKGGQYGYPHTMIYKNDFYIIVSRQKEAIEIIRLKIDQLR